MGFLSKLLTMGEGKQLKRYQAKVDKINALEPEFQALSDEELAAKTQEFRERYAAGESLDDLLPEAFAAVREASVRTIGLRHFDVQLIGGMALNEGQIAEMKTGEGKTLVSTLAGYLNAIPGHNVHIVTVNDYLARRDCEWMGQIYRFLGMKTGLIQNGMPPAAKKPAYEADVTYGTNSEFGFDYLRDNMVTRGSSRVQRGHHFAIVDEVDSILIDEARTPLIISGAGTQAADTYKKFARVMPGLKEGVDFDMDEAKRTINATESGLEKIEVMLGIENIYADPSGQLANHLQQALKAQFLFHRDVDYVVMDGEVKIVDEFTGRIMEGRRYSEGLHQALEAKEHVLVREENQTLATITLQNYFRLYDKLSGMTGTAMTEDAEFRQIYKLPVMAIPPNKPVIRVDENDLVYRTIDGKFNAVADDIAARHAKGQPCLIGTVSIENSEKLSRLLDKRGIKHETLNAKHHEREAHIVAQAGRLGAVTIATNMAGRGTDIRLGGEPDMLAEDLLRERGFDVEAQEGDEEARGPIPSAADRADALTRAREICDAEQEQVLAAGGLCVIGTERSSQIHILQTFPDWPAECSSIDWLALGNTEHSVFIPFFSGITDTAPAYHLDGDTYNPDGAFWKFKSICTIAEQNRSLYSQGVKDFWKLQEELMYQEMLDAAPAMLAKYSESRAAGDAYVTQLGIDMAEREMLLADNLYAKLLTTMMHNTGLSSSKTPTTFLSDVPLRQVAESRGYTVTWNKADGSTTIAKGDVTYTFTPESYECVTGTGETIELTHYCYVRDGFTYIPMDFAKTL